MSYPTDPGLLTKQETRTETFEMPILRDGSLVVVGRSIYCVRWSGTDDGFATLGYVRTIKEQTPYDDGR